MNFPRPGNWNIWSRLKSMESAWLSWLEHIGTWWTFHDIPWDSMRFHDIPLVHRWVPRLELLWRTSPTPPSRRWHTCPPVAGARDAVDLATNAAARAMCLDIVNSSGQSNTSIRAERAFVCVRICLCPYVDWYACKETWHHACGSQVACKASYQVPKPILRSPSGTK